MASSTDHGSGQRGWKAFPGGTGEIYQYGQNGMLLEETDQSGTPQADYIYLNGRPIATLNPATGTLYYLQDDRLGTPQLATDSSQTVAWQAAHGPFGQASVSGSITQNLRFPGQYYDIETGWNHNGFRDYIPALGRYAEPDPLGRLGSGNDLYGYVGDDPENFVDPYGLIAKCGCQPAKMHLSPAGADFIGKGYENPGKKGFDAKSGLWFPYGDGYGFPTEGYGHRIKKGEDFSHGLTTNQVRSLFDADAAKAVAAVNRMTHRCGMTQNEFDALVSLQFNAGPYALTPPLHDFNQTGTATKDDFTQHYLTSGGVYSRGLAKRRFAEWIIFSEGVYDSAH